MWVVCKAVLEQTKGLPPCTCPHVRGFRPKINGKSSQFSGVTFSKGRIIVAALSWGWKIAFMPSSRVSAITI